MQMCVCVCLLAWAILSAGPSGEKMFGKLFGFVASVVTHSLYVITNAPQIPLKYAICRDSYAPSWISCLALSTTVAEVIEASALGWRVEKA